MQNLIFRWSEEKNEILKKERGLSFEKVIEAIEEGDLLEIIPNQSKNHQEQDCFVVRLGGYACIVPYVEDEEGIFLKTIYRSRKYQKLLLNK